MKVPAAVWPASIFEWVMQKLRTRGSWLTGANSAHFLLVESADLKAGSETQGEFHFGEHNPYSPLGWLLHWFFEVLR